MSYDPPSPNDVIIERLDKIIDMLGDITQIYFDHLNKTVTENIKNHGHEFFPSYDEICEKKQV